MVEKLYQIIIVCYKSIVEILNYHISPFPISSTIVMMDGV